MSGIKIVATVVVKPEYREALLAQFADLVAASRRVPCTLCLLLQFRRERGRFCPFRACCARPKLSLRFL